MGPEAGSPWRGLASRLSRVRTYHPMLFHLGDGKGFVMSAWERRIRQRALVKQAYEQLKDCLAGEFAPGYFNSPSALAAERNGLEMCDAVLGHKRSR